mgnify:CR=1 FL=1
MLMDTFQSVKTGDAIMSSVKMTGFYLAIFGGVVTFLGTCFDEARAFSAALIALMKGHAFMSACAGAIFYSMLINLMVQVQVRPCKGGEPN